MKIWAKGKNSGRSKTIDAPNRELTAIAVQVITSDSKISCSFLIFCL